jgi:2-polyprenyl-6-methoxyphenol hydroxylase-like FAD-dependent oxidoreductase
VQRLRHRAAAHPSVTMRQGVALRLLCADGSEWDEGSLQPVAGVQYKGADGSIQHAFAHLTVACDGMYSMLRKHLHECASSVRCVFDAHVLTAPFLQRARSMHCLYNTTAWSQNC